MKRCECGNSKFCIPYEVVAEYRVEGDLLSFELIGICTYPDHEQAGNVICEGCGEEYKEWEEIPDAPDTPPSTGESK